MLVAASTVSVFAPAHAQNDAGSKARGDFNFYGAPKAGMYQRHPYDHSRTLNDYSSAGQPVPKPVIQEHTKGIRGNIDASKKAYAQVDATTKKDPTVAKQLEIIGAALDKALAMCDVLDSEGGKSDGDTVTVQKCCVDIEKELKAADDAHQKLMKQLKVTDPKQASKKK